MPQRWRRGQWKVDRPDCTVRRIAPPPQSQSGHRSPSRAVDGEPVLEIAEFPVGPTMIAQGRTARVDGFRQHAANRGRQPLGPTSRHGPGDAERRDPGPVQAFADIDVAEPRDHRLIEQRRLHRPPAPGQPFGQHRAGKGVGQRLGPESRQHRVIVERALGGQVHETESAGVVVPHHGPRIGLELHMVVRLGRRWVGFEDAKAARHAEMGDQHRPVVETEQQELGPPIQRFDAPPPRSAPRNRRAAENADRACAPPPASGGAPATRAPGPDEPSRPRAVRASGMHPLFRSAAMMR